MDASGYSQIQLRRNGMSTGVTQEPVSGERRFRLLVESVTDYAICMLDQNGLVGSWNSGAQRITGYTAEEVLGQNFARFFTPEDRERGKPAQLLSIAASEGRYQEEAWRMRKDGGRFWASIAIDRVNDEKGDFIGFAEITQDVTDRHAASAALAESERQFRTLVDSVVDYAIFMLDTTGKVRSWNAGARRIKGYEAREIIGQHFSRFYTEEDRAAGEPARALHTAETAGKYEREGWRVRQDGTRFWAGVVIDPIRDGAGQLIGFAKITRDLTERRQAQEALEQTRAALLQSQKMEAIGQLTGGVAHDFNNLLTVIANGLDLLSRPSLDEHEKRRIIASAQRATDRGAKLTQQLLAFARRQPLRPQTHDVNGLIGGFEAVLRRAAGETVATELDLATAVAFVRVDAAQFEAALLNLVVNARDAVGDGGRLKISTDAVEVDAARAARMSGIEPGPYVVVSVHDNGAGMTPDVVERAFEPFFTTKETGKGSGLGLSQVYGFVTQSQGHVELRSVPGQGTTVSLYLPAAPPEAGAEGQRPKQRGDSAGTVLVVEDDPEVLEVAVATLRSLGYDVLTAADGESALAVLRRGQPIDVLFSDVVMPKGMNGVELARRACALRPELRVVLASGYPMSALSAEHGLDGQFSFLSKPYRWTELQEKLRAPAHG